MGGTETVKRGRRRRWKEECRRKRAVKKEPRIPRLASAWMFREAQDSFWSLAFPRADPFTRQDLDQGKSGNFDLLKAGDGDEVGLGE